MDAFAGYVILIVGVVLFLIGMTILFSKIKLLFTCRIKTEAVVYSVRKDAVSVRGSKVYSYIPQFSYQYNEVEYIGETSFSTLKVNKYKPKDKMYIFVNPKKPDDFRVRGGIGAYIVGALFAFVGTMLIVLFFM